MDQKWLEWREKHKRVRIKCVGQRAIKMDQVPLMKTTDTLKNKNGPKTTWMDQWWTKMDQYGLDKEKNIRNRGGDKRTIGMDQIPSMSTVTHDDQRTISRQLIRCAIWVQNDGRGMRDQKYNEEHLIPVRSEEMDQTWISKQTKKCMKKIFLIKCYNTSFNIFLDFQRI